MKVEVRLFATLRNNRFKKEEREFKEETNVQVIVDDLNIDHDEIAILLVNGRDGHLFTVLKEGDRVSIFPPVGGG